MRAYAQASGLLTGNDLASAPATLKRYRRRKARETAPRRAPLAGTKLEAYRFARSTDEEVRATVEVFRGRLFLHLRIWFRGRDDIWRRTKRGVCVAVELLPELERAVAALKATVAERP